MKITKIECHVLLDPEYDPAATSSAQDDLVVEVHTDEGIVGIGETDLNPWIARECIEAPGTHTMDQGLGSIRDRKTLVEGLSSNRNDRKTWCIN